MDQDAFMGLNSPNKKKISNKDLGRFTRNAMINVDDQNNKDTISFESDDDERMEYDVDADQYNIVNGPNDHLADMGTETCNFPAEKEVIKNLD